MATLDHICGGECGIVSAGATTTVPKHWDAAITTGGTITTVTSPVRNGGRAIRMEANATGELHFQKLPASETTRAWRFGLYFDTLPSADTVLLRYVTAAGRDFQIRYLTATQQIQASWDAVTTGFTAVNVSTGVWYLVEAKADVTINPFTATWQVDGVGKGTGVNVQTATTVTQWRIGLKCAGETFTTGVILLDDIISGGTIAEYPYGDGRTIGIRPTGDGTHSFSTAGDFVYEAAGGNIATSATDTYTHIDDVLNQLSVFLNAALAATGEYLEWTFSGMPAVTSINGLNLVSSHFAATTSTNLQSLRLVDGGSTNDAVNDADFSQTSLCYFAKPYSTAPSGGAWTQAKVNAVKLRWTSSWTSADVNPDAYIAGVVLEVDYVPSQDVTGSGSPTETLVSSGAGTATQTFTGSGTPTETLGATGAGTAAQKFNGSGSPTKTLSVSGSGTAVQKFVGTGTPTETLGATASGSAVQRFNGSGTPTKTLSSSVVATAVQKFVGAGSPTETLGATGSGTATQTLGGTGSPTETLEASGSGTATMTPGVEPPSATRAHGNSRGIVIISDDKDAEPVTERASVIEARGLPDMPAPAPKGAPFQPNFPIVSSPPRARSSTSASTAVVTLEMPEMTPEEEEEYLMAWITNNL